MYNEQCTIYDTSYAYIMYPASYIQESRDTICQDVSIFHPREKKWCSQTMYNIKKRSPLHHLHLHSTPYFLCIKKSMMVNIFGGQKTCTEILVAFTFLVFPVLRFHSKSLKRRLDLAFSLGLDGSSLVWSDIWYLLFVRRFKV